jgi:hypothetical protein
MYEIRVGWRGIKWEEWVKEDTVYVEKYALHTKLRFSETKNMEMEGIISEKKVAYFNEEIAYKYKVY